MSSILTIALYIFLLIFFATAVLTLLALIGIVKMQHNYLKQLFRLLILQVIAVVITFVSDNVLKDKTTFISQDILLKNQGLWDGNYPERSWRTKMTFKEKGDSLRLVGTTYQRYKGEDIAIIDWKSIDKIEIPSLSREIKFRTAMRWRNEIVQIDSNMRYEAGIWREGTTTLHQDIALSGSFRPDSAGNPWGIILTHTWQ